MKRLRRLYSVVAVAAFAISMIVLPASAATAPATTLCIGTLTFTSPGLSGTRQAFSWSLNTLCDAVSSDGAEQFDLNASGIGTGSCDWSSAAGGSGTLSRSSQSVGLTNIGWEGGRSVLLVTGNHDAGGAGTFAAEVEAQDGAYCSPQDRFEVVMVAEFA
jgi:hypothetical protein